MPTRDDDPVHPYYRAILDAYAQSGRPSYHQVTPPAARELLRSSLAAAPPQQNLPELAAVENFTISAAGRGIPARRYRPLEPARGVGI